MRATKSGPRRATPSRSNRSSSSGAIGVDVSRTASTPRARAYRWAIRSASADCACPGRPSARTRRTSSTLRHRRLQGGRRRSRRGAACILLLQDLDGTGPAVHRHPVADQVGTSAVDATDEGDAQLTAEDGDVAQRGCVLLRHDPGVPEHDPVVGRGELLHHRDPRLAVVRLTLRLRRQAYRLTAGAPSPDARPAAARVGRRATSPGRRRPGQRSTLEDHGLAPIGGHRELHVDLRFQVLGQAQRRPPECLERRRQRCIHPGARPPITLPAGPHTGSAPVDQGIRSGPAEVGHGPRPAGDRIDAGVDAVPGGFDLGLHQDGHRQVERLGGHPHEVPDGLG